MKFSQLLSFGELLNFLPFVLGHIVRDGWPSFKRFTSGILGTHAARIVGSIVCSIYLPFVYSWQISLILFFSILFGFYLDQKHGEGQGAEGGTQAPFLVLSGFTSCLLTALAFTFFGYFFNTNYYINALLAVILSLFKPFVWWSFQHSMPQKWIPTRWAAGTFGALYGFAVGYN